jgi:hypothetical protein
VQPFLLAALPVGQLALGAQAGYQFGQGIGQVQNGDTASGALNIFGGALTAVGGVGYYANEAKTTLRWLGSGLSEYDGGVCQRSCRVSSSCLL